MNKQNTNHLMMLKLFITTLEKQGITSNIHDDIHYIQLPKYRGYCHIKLIGVTPCPIFIKTAYAEDFSNNQAIRYLGQLDLIHDDVLFVYAGNGWKKQTHLEVLTAIRNRLGNDHVINLTEVEHWLHHRLGGTKMTNFNNTNK